MGTKLERIAEISAESKKPVFTSIYHLINAELLKQCHKELDGKKAVGVDKVTKEEYGKNLDRNIEDLVQRLKNKSFKPLPSLRVYIPKGNGKMRPLGIASYEDKIVQMAVDVHNFLGRFAIWVLIALCISIYSNSAIRASVNVFAFFVGMVTSYYLYSNYVAGFFPRSYAMIWFGFTIISPFLAFVCWYAKGKGKLAFMLSILILAVLFNMTFVYGWGYFEALSVLELAVFIIGLTVLKRDTLKSSVLMGAISIVLAFLLDMVIPFHFG